MKTLFHLNNLRRSAYIFRQQQFTFEPVQLRIVVSLTCAISYCQRLLQNVQPFVGLTRLAERLSEKSEHVWAHEFRTRCLTRRKALPHIFNRGFVAALIDHHCRPSACDRCVGLEHRQVMFAGHRDGGVSTFLRELIVPAKLVENRRKKEGAAECVRLGYFSRKV